jgi:hypothetical protein
VLTTVIAVSKTYSLDVLFTGHQEWETTKAFNGTPKTFSRFLLKKLQRTTKERGLFVVGSKWVLGVDPLDLLLSTETLEVNIISARVTIFANGYLLEMRVNKGTAVTSFLEYGPKGHTYVKKTSPLAKDMEGE